MNTKKIKQKVKKNMKALSPVVASIILIAVTVAASVVVAARIGGMTLLMDNTEQAQVTNIEFTTSGGDIALAATVHNTGINTLTISAAYIDGVKTTDTYTTGNTIIEGQSAVITVSNSTSLASSAIYEVKMVTINGTSISYSFNP